MSPGRTRCCSIVSSARDLGGHAAKRARAPVRCRPGGWPRHGVVHNVYNGKQPGEEFIFTMMVGAAAAFGTDDGAAREAVIRNLVRWAEDDGLGKFKENPAPSMYYNLDRTLLPLIVAFSLVQDHPSMTAGDRQRIEQWLDRLVWRRGPGPGTGPDLSRAVTTIGT